MGDTGSPIEGVTAEQVQQIRDVAERGHAPEEVLARLRQCLSFYDMTRKAWLGTRDEYTELDEALQLKQAELNHAETRIGELEAQLRQSEALREESNRLLTEHLRLFNGILAVFVIGAPDTASAPSSSTPEPPEARF